MSENRSNGVVNPAFKGEEVDINKMRESGAQLIGITKLNNDLENRLDKTPNDKKETAVNMTSSDTGNGVHVNGKDATEGGILKSQDVVISINSEGNRYTKHEVTLQSLSISLFTDENALKFVKCKSIHTNQPSRPYR